ncbi:hypothetical protein CFB46_31105 [Burkholderia sp. HI2761]|nr:hypothetical protein CFB46_31105 [Burkholderia sp. HI2761]
MADLGVNAVRGGGRRAGARDDVQRYHGGLKVHGAVLYRRRGMTRAMLVPSTPARHISRNAEASRFRPSA